WIAPTAPTQLHATSKSPTSVLLEWSRSDGHTGAGKYSIVRDGATVGSVSGDQSSFREEGLRPGQSYTYSVVAESWLRQSAPAQDTTVRVLAPSPKAPTRGSVSTNSVSLRWAPP